MCKSKVLLEEDLPLELFEHLVYISRLVLVRFFRRRLKHRLKAQRSMSAGHKPRRAGAMGKQTQQQEPMCAAEGNAAVSAVVTSSTSSKALGFGGASSAEGGRKDGTYFVAFLLDSPIGIGAATTERRNQQSCHIYFGVCPTRLA